MIETDLNLSSISTVKQEEQNLNSFQYINNFVESLVNEKNNAEDLHLKYEFKILPYSEPNDGKELFKCPMCNIDNIQGRKELTDHLHNHQIQHKVIEGRHLCCLCGKELSSNSSLERHLLTHSNHRPYSCEICNKKFTTNGNLSRHMKASHSTNIEKIDPPMPMDIDKVPQFPTISPPLKQELNVIPKSFNSHPLPLDFMSGLSPIQLPKSVFMKLFEITINSLPIFNCNNFNRHKFNEVLNLSTKSGSSSNEYLVPPKSEFNNIDYRSFYESMNNTGLDVVDSCMKNSVSVQDTPLDLSVRSSEENSVSTSNKGRNSFLSTPESDSFNNIISNNNKESESDIDVGVMNTINTGNLIKPINGFRIKKNSYKDAPKLIRCPVIGCAQKFPWNSSLMRHILTHTAHKPFKCIRCPKCFSTKSNRERHMHRVHGIQASGRQGRSYAKLVGGTGSVLSSPGLEVNGSSNYSMTQSDLVGQVNTNSFLPTSNCAVAATTCIKGSQSRNYGISLPAVTDYLSEQEWMEMTNYDRQAEDISHSLLRQAGEPVVEPNPLRRQSRC